MKRLLLLVVGVTLLSLPSEAQRLGTLALADVTLERHSTVVVSTYAAFNLAEAEAGERVPLAVYPNPAVDRAGAQFTLEVGQRTIIDVFDLLGRRVQQKELGLLEAGQHEVNIDLRGLPHGLYIVRLTGEAGARATVRLTVATSA